MRQYDHKKIEGKWQKEWAKKKQHVTADKVAGKKNFYLLTEFPYPSGNLHVGHWYAFAVPDILARHMRMTGHNVMYPFGFDAFGLPAENAAIKRGLNPRKWTEGNIAYMKKQLASMGASFDWSREVQTIDPDYYRWTQWLFLQFYKKGLAYKKDTPVNWCPKDKTVLANEQVVSGKCERCGEEVEQRNMLQWNLKITDYADRLADDLDALNWPHQIKESQRNWIGRSEGAEIDFPLDIDTMNHVIFLHCKGGSPDSDFIPWAKKELEKRGYTVEAPALPNASEPDDIEQAEFALKNCRIDEKTIVIGHSSGGLAAMRLLEKTKAGRLVLVATPYTTPFRDGKARPSVARSIQRGYDFEAIKENVGGVIAMYDTHDPIVPMSDGKYYTDSLGGLLLADRGQTTHFNGMKEPAVLMAATPTIRVFTTRPDTLYGVTYLVLSPEHQWVKLALGHETVLKNNDEVQKYVTAAGKKTELERQESREKTGVKLEGVEAVNPATGEKIPVYVADYVLAHYGTGAIMAVPAHDERDREFAQAFDLPVKPVIAEGPKHHYTEGKVIDGHVQMLVNSGPFDMMHVEEAKQKITEQFGVKKTTYKMRDWVVSRQRYWGVPIPIVHCPKCGDVPVPDKDLPVKLPDVKDYLPTGDGKSPLAKVKKFVETECPSCVEKAKKTKYLIFDFDGVLADSYRASLEARVRMGEAKNIAEAKQTLEAYFSKKPTHARGDHFTEERYQKFHDWSTRYAVAKAGIKYRMFDGFIKEIKKLKNVKIAIVSTGYDNYSKGPLKKSGLKYTHFLAGNHDHSKENKIEKVCKAWKVDVKDVYYFTDTQADVYELENLLDRTKLIGCAWGYQGEKKLREILPREQVLKKFTDIHGLWKPCIAARETDTFDTFVDSSWYFQRYTDSKNKKLFADPKKLATWMPVDLYSGGAEHTTMHLLYSRFWHKAMYDIGLVREGEPYTRRMNRSIILGPDGQKMSKSRGNVIDPDEVVQKLGADTVRMYLAFIGPYNEVASYPWNPDGVVGVRRFLERVWRLQEKLVKKTEENVERALHIALKKVTDDIPLLKFNTAIAAMMTLLNEAEGLPAQSGKGMTKAQYLTLLRMIAPFAPHMAEELWRELGNKKSIHFEKWPKYDEKKTVQSTVMMVVQVNGKVRAQITAAADAAEQDIQPLAEKAAAKWLEGQVYKKVIFVPGRLINFVV